MPKKKDPERIYYEELFEAIDIPFIRRNTPNSGERRVGITYFINPITGRQNELSLQNLRRSVEQMISEGVMPEDIRFNPEEINDNDTDVEIKENDEKVESKNSYENPTFSSLRDILKQNKGKMIRIVISKNSYTILDVTYRVPKVGFGGFWMELSRFDLMEDSENPIIPISSYGGDFLNSNYTMEAFIINEINQGIPIEQRFKEGIKHCILFPIKKWAKECYDLSKSKSAKSRYNAKLKKITNLIEEYKDGVPERDLQNICELLQVDIKVDLPLNITDPYLYFKSTKKKLKTFEFINTRLNHVDFNEIVNNDFIKSINRNELYELKDVLDEKNEYYIYNKDLRGISSITTFKGKYIINNDYYKTTREFENKYGFGNYMIDDIDNKELSEFIKYGTHYNSTVDFKDVYRYKSGLKKVLHIDMEKAYANFHTCKWYEGFIGKITDFRKTTCIEGVGLYLVDNFDFSKCKTKFKNYNNTLRIYCDGNVYGSAELKMLSDYDVEYNIVAGCWGVKSFDFKFTDDMLNNKDNNGIRYYARWTGGCDQHHLEKNFYMKGEFDLFQNIRNYVSNGKVKWVGVDEGCISYKKEHNYHLGHISAQITMYQRMNVIEQLLEMEIGKIIRVCVDGIYYEPHEFNLKNVFREKDNINFGNEAGDRYGGNIFIKEFDEFIDNHLYHPERKHYAKELHLGAGGTGKTHKVLTDKGLVKVLYIAPSRKLVRAKNKDYGVRSEVICNLITSDTERFMEIARFNNVLVFDEVSMYSEQSKELIFNRFPYHKIIFCGDIGYQLPTFEGDGITCTGFDKIFDHKTNYRIKCKELQKLCDILRGLIKRGIDNNIISKGSYCRYINQEVKNFFLKKHRVIDKEELQEIYDIKDYIIVGTKKIGWEYTGLFAGTFRDSDGHIEEKYYIKANNSEMCNGDIVYSEKKPEGCNSEIRHHFTTHSIQGETIESRIFIDISKMFDSRMFYTAISRAERLNQIYIIQNVKS